MIDLLLKVFDLLLGGLFEKRRRRKALSDQLEALKRHILNVNLANNLPIELARLRVFMLETGLVEKPQFDEFFGRWLTDSIVVEGKHVLGVFTNEQIEELFDELSRLEL